MRDTSKICTQGTVVHNQHDAQGPGELYKSAALIVAEYGMFTFGSERKILTLLQEIVI